MRQRLGRPRLDPASHRARIDDQEVTPTACEFGLAVEFNAVASGRVGTGPGERVAAVAGGRSPNGRRPSRRWTPSTASCAGHRARHELCERLREARAIDPGLVSSSDL